MASTEKATEIERLVATIVDGMQERKAKNILTLDLRQIPNTVCGFFVICTGDSSTHVEGISGSVQEQTRKQLNDRPWHVEGMGHSEWVLLDYVNVVVHVFQREPREFYNIERLWADAKTTVYTEDGKAKVLPQVPKKETVKKPRAAKPKVDKKAAPKGASSRSGVKKGKAASPKAKGKTASTEARPKVVASTKAAAPIVKGKVSKVGTKLTKA
jgi:ribosome-associated protein